VEAEPASGTRARTGWIAFAGVYLLVAGAMNAVWGLAALTDRTILVERSLAWSTLTTWGWVSVAVAAVQLSAGALVLARKVVGRALVANGLVLWAVTVYWGERQ
jgi:hypothetical protein